MGLQSLLRYGPSDVAFSLRWRVFRLVGGYRYFPQTVVLLGVWLFGYRALITLRDKGMLGCLV